MISDVLSKVWAFLKKLLYNKEALLIIVGILVLLFIYNMGYVKGKSHIKIVKDTVLVHDTTTITDTAYTPAKVDTIIDSILSNHPYVAEYGEYMMHRDGYVHVWYIPDRELFRWNVQEPKPLLMTNTKMVPVRVPTIDYKACAISGAVGFVGGVITILLLSK